MQVRRRIAGIAGVADITDQISAANGSAIHEPRRVSRKMTVEEPVLTLTVEKIHGTPTSRAPGHLLDDSIRHRVKRIANGAHNVDRIMQPSAPAMEEGIRQFLLRQVIEGESERGQVLEAGLQVSGAGGHWRGPAHRASTGNRPDRRTSHGNGGSPDRCHHGTLFRNNGSPFNNRSRLGRNPRRHRLRGYRPDVQDHQQKRNQKANWYEDAIQPR